MLIYFFQKLLIYLYNICFKITYCIFIYLQSFLYSFVHCVVFNFFNFIHKFIHIYAIGEDVVADVIT
jgi:hypothetical protein